jgi:hypothetical protein
MAKPSAQEKLVLTFLITNSEIYRLNEKEALEYIHYNFSKPISRRTLYNYKKMIYNNCMLPYNNNQEYENNDLQFFKSLQKSNSINCKQLSQFSLLDAKEDFIREGLNINIYLENIDKLNLFPTHFSKLFHYAESAINHSRNFIKQFESRSHSSDTNHESLPTNATIRKEYIKCGKNSCSRCNHGPYYYGYWRDKNGKLKKKYIGRNK